MKNIKNSNKFGRVHLDMIKAVVAFVFAMANVAITNSIEAFAAVMNAIKANLTAIGNLQQASGVPVTGYAAQKKLRKQTLSEFSAAILQSVVAYAVKTSNKVLLEKVDKARAELLKMADSDLIEYISAAIDAVGAEIANLAPYNISDETMNLWKENLNALVDLISDPKNQHTHQNTLKKDIQNLLKVCMEMLYNQADVIALQFKQDNLSYYNEYRANRKLIPNTRHTKFEVTVTDELNQPIANVVVSQNDAENSTTTGINGKATLDVKVKDGEKPLYNFTLSKGNQRIETGLIEIKRGNKVSQDYVMAPSGFVIPKSVPQKSFVRG